MKAGRLIELLEGVSHDAEVMCCISTDGLEEVTNMTLADFNALKKYEIFAVLNSDEDEEFCRLLLKKGGKDSMIDEKLLLYFIKTRSREFEEQSFTIHKECTDSLRDMEYNDVIIHTVNLNTLMNVTRILNELIEMIEDGKFNTSENSVSCCGGECGKQ